MDDTQITKALIAAILTATVSKALVKRNKRQDIAEIMREATAASLEATETIIKAFNKAPEEDEGEKIPLLSGDL